MNIYIKLGDYPQASFGGNLLQVATSKKGDRFYSATVSTTIFEGSKPVRIGFDGRSCFRMEKGKPTYEDPTVATSLQMAWASFSAGSPLYLEMVSAMDQALDGESAPAVTGKASKALKNEAVPA